ncbi:MAG: alpha/beta hydrolase [Pseudomonadota bacterium]|nr:alpha/beta hydrolase [Pseudomonadota bacterium]
MALLLTSLLLPGCMSLDSFFFNGTAVTEYTLASDVIPAEALEEVSFSTDDDLTLAGVWAHQPVASAPVLLYFHGNADNIDAYMGQLGDYWSFGYEVFIFDYRGYGKSEGSPTYDGVLTDGFAAVDYVEGATGLSVADIPFLGLSLGGSVATRVASVDAPKVLITEDMFANGQKLMNDGSGLDLPDGWLLVDEWDNAAAAAEVTSPFLVIHGDSDTYIQPESAEEIFEAITTDPKRLWLVPGADHAEAAQTEPELYRDNVACWITQSCTEE